MPNPAGIGGGEIKDGFLRVVTIFSILVRSPHEETSKVTDAIVTKQQNSLHSHIPAVPTLRER